MPTVHEGNTTGKDAAPARVQPIAVPSLIAEFLDDKGTIEGRHRAALVEALVGEPAVLEALLAISKEADAKAKKKASRKLPGRPLSSLVDEILAFAKRPRMSWGIPELDARAPWPYGSIATLIGPTGRGKTSLALQVAAHHAATAGPALVVSAELAAVVMAARRASQMSQASWLDVLSGGLDRESLHRALDCPDLYIIDDVREEWVDDVIAYLAHWKKTRAGKTPLVVVDYYQILPAPGDDDQARTKWVIANLLDEICKPFEVPVLGISKTSRANAKALRSGEAIGADTTEAGAESNAIEYGSVVQISLGELVENADGPATMQANVSKARFGRGDCVVPLEYDGAHGWFRPGGDAKTSAEVRSEKALGRVSARDKGRRDAVVAFLATRGEAPATVIRAEVGGRKGDVLRLLSGLVREGVLEQVLAAGGNASSRFKLKNGHNGVAAARDGFGEL